MRWTTLLESPPAAAACCPWPAHCSCGRDAAARPAPRARLRPTATRGAPWETPLGIDLGRSGDSWEQIRLLLERGAPATRGAAAQNRLSTRAT